MHGTYRIISKNYFNNRLQHYTLLELTLYNVDSHKTFLVDKDLLCYYDKAVENLTIYKSSNTLKFRVNNCAKVHCNKTASELYNTSKLIYNRWRMSNTPIDNLILAWSNYCKSVNYYDPFKYNINAINGLIQARYNEVHSINIYGGTILPYFVQSTEKLFESYRTSVLDLSAFNTENVINMSNMFEGTHADRINLKSFNTSNVKYMEAMFRGVNVKELDLSSFNTDKVTRMDGMFYGSYNC